MPDEQAPHGCLVIAVTFAFFFGGAVVGALVIRLIEPSVFGAAAFFFLPLVFVGGVVMATAIMLLTSLWALLTERRKLFSELPQVDEREERRAQAWVLPGALLSSLVQGAILALWAPVYLVALAKLTVLGTLYGALMMLLARRRLLPLGAFLDLGPEPPI